MKEQTTNENLVKNSNQSQSNDLSSNGYNDNVVVWLYNVTDFDTFVEIHRKLEKLEYLHELNGISSDFQKLSQSIRDEICGDNFLRLSEPDWDEFVQKYIWSFIIKNGLPVEDYTPCEVLEDSKTMILLLNYLKSFNHISDFDKKIIDFLNMNKNGVTQID